MKESWEKYALMFDSRAIRERIIIALCVLASVYLVWDFAFVQGLNKKRAALDARYDRAAIEIEKFSAEEKVLSQALRSNPNAEKQREILQLKDRVAELDKEIERLSGGLVPAAQLPEVLRDILFASQGIELVGIVALKPEKLSLVGAAESESARDVEQAANLGVFRHKVVLKLRGQYFSIRDYLASLEKSDWYFYWSKFEYSVDNYPSAVAQLEVYTLSTDRGFIGE